jgi:hypothetical protein
MEFDTDSYEILIDNCCSHSLTNCIEDFKPPVQSKVKVRGYNGNTNTTMVGTVKWKIGDDNGILPNTYYSSVVETRLLSPQHWAEVRENQRDAYCVTYYDAIIMKWNKDKYQITAPLDNRKHRNVGVIRTTSGINKYVTSCLALDQEHEILAYPTTINMDEVSDQEEDNGDTYKQLNEKEQPSTTNRELSQMRETSKEVTLRRYYCGRRIPCIYQ